MKRNIIIGLGVLWLILVLLVWLWPAGDDTTNPKATNSETTTSSATTGDDTITITTKDDPVAIKDIRKQTLQDFGYGVLLFYEDERVSLLYYSQSDYFLINLETVTNLASDRQYAETIFLQELAISQSEACRLAVDVVVPHYINYSLAGSYPLSFCNDGV